MALYEASRCFPQAIFARSGVDASEKGLRQLRNIVDHMAVPAPFANRIIVDTDRDDLDTTRFEYRDYVFAELGIVCNSVRHNHENAPLVSDVIKEIRSEEHTSELQSLMRISYAVFCLKKKKTTHYIHPQ